MTFFATSFTIDSFIKNKITLSSLFHPISIYFFFFNRMHFNQEILRILIDNFVEKYPLLSVFFLNKRKSTIKGFHVFRLHGGDNVQIKRYFVSFWNGVDLRYKLLKGPKIRISIAGIIISRVSNFAL